MSLPTTIRLQLHKTNLKHPYYFINIDGTKVSQSLTYLQRMLVEKVMKQSVSLKLK